MAKKNKRPRARLARVQAESPGTKPGLVVPREDAVKTTLAVIAYDSDAFDEKHDVEVDEALALAKRREKIWLDFSGLGDAEVIRRVGKAFGLHHLTLEDVVQPHQRAKVENFGGYVYVVLRMVRFVDDRLDSEQLSIVVGKNFIVTFQEGKPGDSLGPVRTRLRRPNSELRRSGCDFLAYSLIDAVIDHYFPVLNRYADILENYEAQVSDRPYLDVVWQIHGLKRELLELQTMMLPQRDLVQALIREPSALMLEDTRLHFRDVADHTGQILDLLGSYRDMAQALIEIHLNVASNRTNEVMQVLTIFGVVFMPLSFIAGIYGMNFDPAHPYNMPELRSPYGYVATLGFMALVASGLLFYFSRRGWLGRAK